MSTNQLAMVAGKTVPAGRTYLAMVINWLVRSLRWGPGSVFSCTIDRPTM
jgi:hypothetical protein